MHVSVHVFVVHGYARAHVHIMHITWEHTSMCVHVDM